MSAAKAKPTGNKILVVDDEEMIIKIIHYKLGRSGYEIVMATGGDEAYEILAKDNNISLVVTDICMPKGDGISLLKKVRAQPQNPPPVIIMSGFSEYTAGQIIALGAVALLKKPFLPQTLLALVQEHLPNLPQ